jgi:hypothetical protein
MLIVLVVDDPWTISLWHSYPAEVDGARDGHGGEDRHRCMLSMRFADVNYEPANGFPKLGKLFLGPQEVIVWAFNR